MQVKKLSALLALTTALPLTAVAEEAEQEAGKDSKAERAPSLYEEVLVTGGKEGVRTLSGSATFLERETITRFDVVDINELLNQVPGVYIRVEDGYGLRPNIGLRGVTSDRSQKITLMEDSILITPAPYAAPAAYYIPNVNRMEAMEVFKGPSTIQYGPNTVGGSINMVTPPIPGERTGELGLSYGTDNYQKYRVFYGDNHDNFGYWVDLLRYSSDGFKELDGGGDTGFVRNDFNTKLQWRSDESAKAYHQFEVKLGYADENSDETYLGLTDGDFAQNPNRRYVSSQLDDFKSKHYQVHLLHSVNFNNGWSLFTRAYYNRFNRTWFKFDDFLAGPNPSLVLAEPELFPTWIGLLRGEINSDGSPEETLLLTNNDREYGSAGLEPRAALRLEAGNWEHYLQMGVRYHYDYVDRDHSVQSYQMQDFNLVADGVQRPNNVKNTAESSAIAAFFADEIDYRKWKFTLGLRYESIHGEFDDDLVADGKRSNTQDVFIPGAGVFYQVTDGLGLLLGVNKGFSPAGPAAAEDVEPEESINYEYGLRYNRGLFSTEVIGFFSDYSNLLGRCRASDAGCEVGDEFNGGEVEIAGAEVTANYTYMFNNGLSIPMSLVYTYTESAFQTSFRSDFSQWGDVVKGDELPYTPNHRAYARIGLAQYTWSVNFQVNYVGEMREVPGAGEKVDGQFTEALTTYDLAASWNVLPRLRLSLIGKNITDEQEIVSRRPFGARPNMPRRIEAGVNYSFF